MCGRRPAVVLKLFTVPICAQGTDLLVFLREIQRVDQWELFIRRILDNERVEVMLTGSSAKLLSREIGTAMRGRSLATEVFPLSFCEYCRFQDVHVPERSVYGDRDRYALAKAAEGYLRTGGFPEVQKCEEGHLADSASGICGRGDPA